MLTNMLSEVLSEKSVFILLFDASERVTVCPVVDRGHLSMFGFHYLV